VTKAPETRFGLSRELEIGSFDHFRAALDFGGELGGGFSARFIVVREVQSSFREFVGSDRILVAPP
jgi:outer membrane receptor for ferric coprogen and ferric-rhodotorulic acid